ncbi:hypothetical protein FHR75_000415 [Kineococcus radiotolerans]|uniref:Uncharacterized protein n=2 Tax=Kineococcus radiotolerans TaxID=131568 RepID=A6W8M3_KINRD|nr:hypothetical protein [Kineococcus radiotolerans]ABS03162.1 hypothetical protein Krad_1676 [Kineococcus radiotolerans SRS30216 = ATCC BAA-149]MBB2899627.1 hypothetical protein [Kineococcus radiotolerans]
MTAIVLAVSLLLAGPSVLAALEGTGDVDTALLHLVLALVVTAVAGHLVRGVVRGYQAQAAENPPHPAGEQDAVPGVPGRRRDDF